MPRKIRQLVCDLEAAGFVKAQDRYLMFVRWSEEDQVYPPLDWD
jgi:hypothetical protein